MSNTNILGSCEVTINSALKRISKLEGEDKQALKSEFKEWINAIESIEKNYDVLYINKIIWSFMHEDVNLDIYYFRLLFYLDFHDLNFWQR